jgi:hypothetical protein
MPDDVFVYTLFATFSITIPIWERCTKEEYEEHTSNRKPLTDKLTLQDICDIVKEVSGLTEYRRVPIYHNSGGILDQISGKEPDDYYYVNILPYHIIYPTQTNVQNYVCYETMFENVNRYNQIIKYQTIVFTIMCEQKNIVEESTGLARHDLIASLLLDQFNWSNYFGTQIHCVSNKATVSDNSYANRVLIFQSETPLNIIRTDGKTRVINNEVLV